VELLGVVDLPCSCFLVCRLSGESLIWSLTAGDDGAMDIVFFLEGVIMRTLIDTYGGKLKNRQTGSGAATSSCRSPLEASS